VSGVRLAWSEPLRKDLLLAAVWFALGTAFYLSGQQEWISDDWLTVPLWQRLAVLAAGAVAVLLRRRAPLGALGLAVLVVIIDWLHGTSLPVVLVLSEALYSATLYGSRRVSRLVQAGSVLTIAALTVGSGALAGDWRVQLLLILQAGVILLLPVWWATELRQHRERTEIARRGAAQQARIAELEQLLDSARAAELTATERLPLTRERQPRGG